MRKQWMFALMGLTLILGPGEATGRGIPQNLAWSGEERVCRAFHALRWDFAPYPSVGDPSEQFDDPPRGVRRGTLRRLVERRGFTFPTPLPFPAPPEGRRSCDTGTGRIYSVPPPVPGEAPRAAFVSSFRNRLDKITATEVVLLKPGAQCYGSTVPNSIGPPSAGGMDVVEIEADIRDLRVANLRPGIGNVRPNEVALPAVNLRFAGPISDDVRERLLRFVFPSEPQTPILFNNQFYVIYGRLGSVSTLYRFTNGPTLEIVCFRLSDPRAHR